MKLLLRFLMAFALGFIGSLLCMLAYVFHSAVPPDQMPINGFLQLPIVTGLCTGLVMALKGAPSDKSSMDKGPSKEH